MKLLFVGDHYPPCERGGYAQLCADLANGLQSRGHELVVLCLDEGKEFPGDRDGSVLRQLQAPISFEDKWPVPLQQLLFEKRRQMHSRQVFRHVIREYGIEVVVFWPNLYGDFHLMIDAENIPGLTVAYYIAGTSPVPSNLDIYWSYAGHSVGIRIVKSLLRGIATSKSTMLKKPRMEHVMCVSEFERQRVIGDGAASEDVVVIHNGIDLRQFNFVGFPSARRAPGEPLNVLYAGRLVEDKGAHTLVDAVGRLHQTRPDLSVNLTWLGTGPKKYLKFLDQLVENYGARDRITKADWISREHVSSFMSRFDVLVLPTIRPEALSRVVLEAMAVGLVIIATPTGGTPEIVRDQQTGLVFEPGDAMGLANCLEKVCGDIDLCDRLVHSARTMVEKDFTMDFMFRSVENQLLQWKDAAFVSRRFFEK